MWQNYLQPVTLADTLRLLAQHSGQARVVAGGTDVLVELQRGIRPAITLIDISKLHELKYIRRDDTIIRLGALATHNDVIASGDCVQAALPLAQACWEVGAPQIRTRATVAGNLITASPANDTITPLLALDAEVVLHSAAGERVVALRDFFTGFRRTVMRPDELLSEIRFPALDAQRRGLFIKLGLRRAQAISVINIGIVLTLDHGQVSEPRITLGCVAPTVIRASTVEAYLHGKRLTPDVCAEAGRLVTTDAAPIDDVRGSADYRQTVLANLLADGLLRIAEGRERVGWPEHPVLLETARPETTPAEVFGGRIKTTINARPYELVNAGNKSLLTALREDAGLTGTKNGCAEGECGACTVWLDGQAVMSCLTPAAQAHGAEVTTIDGLAELASGSSDGLHPLQQSFISCGAVQCGYCIPGMIMAGAKLLEECQQPDTGQVQTALSGNICRCTGYRKILDAVHDAAGQRAPQEAR